MEDKRAYGAVHCECLHQDESLAPIYFMLWRLILAGVLTAVVAQGAEQNNDIIVLREFVIEASRIESSPWLYAALPDYEILSQCDEDSTAAIASHLSNSLELNRRLLPATFHGSARVPLTLILFNHKPDSDAQRRLATELKPEDNLPNFGTGEVERMSGGVETADGDTHCVVQNRWQLDFNYAGGGLDHGPVPTGMAYEMSRISPPLPLWYRFGLIGHCGLLRLSVGSKDVRIARAMWISTAATDRLEAEKELPTIPPVESLFQAGAPADPQAMLRWPSEEWMAEAALLVRWGLFEEPKDRFHDPKAFASFLERSRREPMTEAMFRECFGYGFKELRFRLANYLRGATDTAISFPMSLAAGWPHLLPNPKIREATPGEVARILGDWERMEAAALRTTDPQLSQLYMERAKTTLTRAYSRGERNPRFLAVYGLYFRDAGELHDAEKHLNSAIEAGANRPAANVALAQIRLSEVQKEVSPQREIPTVRASWVLEPILRLQGSGGMTVEGYRFLGELMPHFQSRPPDSYFRLLTRAMSDYPLDPEIRQAVRLTDRQWAHQ